MTYSWLPYFYIALRVIGVLLIVLIIALAALEMTKHRDDDE